MTIDILALAVALIVTTVSLRFLLRSWVVPPAFCACYWTVFVVINCFFPEYSLLDGGLIYIAAVLWVFGLTHLWVSKRLKGGTASAAPFPRSTVVIKPKHFRLGLAATVIGGVAYVVFLQGQDVTVVENVPLWAQLLLITHFAGPVLVGALLGARIIHGVDRYLGMLVLLPALLVSVIYTGRTAFFGPATILATAYLCGTILVTPYHTPLFSMRRAVFVSIAIVASSLYGTAIYVMRMARAEGELHGLKERIFVYVNSFDQTSWDESYEKIRSHLYGQPSSFAHIFRDVYSQPTFTTYKGRFMFAGPLSLLGYERPSHQDYVTVENVETNVYTIFAPPIEDLGIWGSFVWWALLGIASAYWTRKAQQGALTGAALLALLLMNLENGSCFLFRYNSVIGAYAIVVAIAMWVDRQPRALPPPMKVAPPSRMSTLSE